MCKTQSSFFLASFLAPFNIGKQFYKVGQGEMKSEMIESISETMQSAAYLLAGVRCHSIDFHRSLSPCEMSYLSKFTTQSKRCCNKINWKQKKRFAQEVSSFNLLSTFNCVQAHIDTRTHTEHYNNKVHVIRTSNGRWFLIR